MISKTKKIKVSLIITIIASIAVFLWIWHNFHTQDAGAKNVINSNIEINKTKNTSKAPDKPIDVFLLESSPFKNNEYAKFHITTIDKLSKLNKNSTILVSENLMVDSNKKVFIDLAKTNHTILFYGLNITAEKVVSFFDGLVPVVPIDSSIPLKFQAYGITTLNKNLIPIFVSVTSDQSTLNEQSFDNLFNQLYEKK